MKQFKFGFFLIAMLLGTLCGIFQVPWTHVFSKHIAEVFLNILQLISLPIIFLSITSTITSMKNFGEMKIMGWKVLRYAFLTTIVAATIALVFFEIIQPAKNIEMIEQAATNTQAAGSYLQALKNIIPSNLFQAFVENNVIGVVFIAFFFSISTLFLPEKQKTVIHQFFSALFAALMKMTQFIIRLLPIGIWAFTTLFIYEIGASFSQLQDISAYVSTIILANLFQALIVLPLILKSKKISPLRIAKGMKAALVTAFFTKSSNVALPVAMQCAEENLKIPRRITRFSFPLCSVINMNACAGFILITVLFVSMKSGIIFSVPELIIWIFLATFAAIGNAGVPMGCYFLASAFLAGMKVPLYLMGVILPIYTLLDMLETGINVWSDCCITSLLDKSLQEKEIPIEEKNLARSIENSVI